MHKNQRAGGQLYLGFWIQNFSRKDQNSVNLGNRSPSFICFLSLLRAEKFVWEFKYKNKHSKTLKCLPQKPEKSFPGRPPSFFRGVFVYKIKKYIDFHK